MPLQQDPFGIVLEKKIAQSGVREIFTPHAPVNSIDLFLGRAREVQGIIAQINTPGQHCLLFGDRGVGKSSLAKITSEIIFGAKIVKGKLYQHRCSAGSTFAHMLLAPLRDVGIDLKVSEVNEQRQEGAGAEVGVSMGFTAKVGGKSSSTSGKKMAPIFGELLPSTAAEYLSAIQGLLVIDELDALINPKEKWKLAEFIKQLSDSNSKLKILAVGIAQTASELTEGHKSVERCLKETKLRILNDDELEQIIVKGSKKAGIIYEGSVIKTIVKLSGGYPHFTHLMALKCAEIVLEKNASSVSPQILDNALERAAADAEGTLRNLYEKATMSHLSASSKNYANILCAAATIPESEFSADRLRSAYKLRTGEAIKQPALNNYFKRLVSDNGGTVLARKAKGVYGFADPRMACYIRIRNRLI